ncbi:mechanosensitive ion channel family protein [Arenicella sp. 4NH20-0111]|uniref:mechanosensitive ion channel family protein n=1 Tax=Arenicella sp. 4NH20-0111 TaxID=3127648 RepID=UPI003341739A
MNLPLILSPLSELDLVTISVSALLFFAARPICSLLNDSDGVTTRASMMRILNALIIIAILTDAYLLQHKSEVTSQITRSLMVLYFAVVATQIINFFVRQRFGKKRITNNSTSISDTYSSRGLSLIVATVVTLIALISCLRILGFNSLLEAGGALGIAGIALAMTQAAWAPDIIAGLIILNSRLCEEGDVVQFNMDGDKIIASVFRTKLFHTELLDLSNNHRLMIRNNKLRDFGIQNLSRFASAKGLRELMLFNIGYEHSKSDVEGMIQRAFIECDKAEGAREEQFAPEIMVYDTADYAVTWAVYYYIKDVKRLLAIKQIFRAYILEESIRSGISLSTPDLQSNNVTITEQSS